jgi:formylglycine-generating enzyme required for sulfatase activity
LSPLCDVPAGAFVMGSNDEPPPHHVTLRAFHIAKFPVTVAEYACFVGATGRTRPGAFVDEPDYDSWQAQLRERSTHPVVMVSWDDATAYARWLAHVTGRSWRLPTEEEWEKAARGTDGRIYPWGGTFDLNRCNTEESGVETTTPVGSYPRGARPYGVQDMVGNVWEWTSSLVALPGFGAGIGKKSTDYPVERGGSWRYRSVRASFRWCGVIPSELRDNGFRLACRIIGS